MGLYFLSFSDKRWKNQQDRLRKEVEGIFDKIFIYDEDYLMEKKDFWKKHSKFILENKRGFGFWLWKPFLILDTLNKMKDNDILLYMDGGSSFDKRYMAKFNDYINLLKNKSTLLFELAHKNKSWTKMDVIKKFKLDMDFLQSKQLVATNILFKKNKICMELVNEWYKLCSSDYNLINNVNILPNISKFKEHRHDQAILSILVKTNKKYKDNSVIIPDETYFPPWNKPYPIRSKRDSPPGIVKN